MSDLYDGIHPDGWEEHDTVTNQPNTNNSEVEKEIDRIIFNIKASALGYRNTGMNKIWNLDNAKEALQHLIAQEANKAYEAGYKERDTIAEIEAEELVSQIKALKAEKGKADDKTL